MLWRPLDTAHIITLFPFSHAHPPPHLTHQATLTEKVSYRQNNGTSHWQMINDISYYTYVYVATPDNHLNSLNECSLY